MEEEKVIDISKQIKKAERKLRWKRRWNAVKEFWDDNKQYAIIVIPAAAGLIGKGIKVLGRHHNLKLEEKNKDCRCYDASLGHYWELRRKLTNADWVKINRRKNNGEKLGDILEEMGGFEVKKMRVATAALFSFGLEEIRWEFQSMTNV